MIFIHIFFVIIVSLRYIFELLLYLFSYNFYLIKIIFILLFTFIFYKLSLRKYKLSTLRRKKYQAYSRYKINDENDLDISISILFLYMMLFIFGIFFLRIKNMERYLNIKEYLTKISFLMQDLNFFDFLLNSLLVIFVIIIYMTLFSLFVKLMKFHFFRVYYYLFLNLYSTAKNMLLMLHWKDYLCLNYYTMELRLGYLNEKLAKFPLLEYFLSMHISGLQFIIHRILLIIIILYDILYNNMVLTHMFKVLPFIFIYEIWCKLSIFLTGLNLDYDKVIAILLYGIVTEIEYDYECLYLNDVPYEKTVLKFIIMSYARNGSIDKTFLPQNPVNEGIQDILNCWKHLFYKMYKIFIKTK